MWEPEVPARLGMSHTRESRPAGLEQVQRAKHSWVPIPNPPQKYSCTHSVTGMLGTGLTGLSGEQRVLPEREAQPLASRKSTGICSPPISHLMSLLSDRANLPLTLDTLDDPCLTVCLFHQTRDLPRSRNCGSAFLCDGSGMSRRAQSMRSCGMNDSVHHGYTAV